MRYLPYKFTAKEQDEETGFYYYGARYLDAKYSRWLSTDPAVSDYIPLAPVDDEAKKHNQQLPGQGGVFNVVNFQLYHYAGNNPVKYTDPDGRYSFNQFKSDLTFAVNTNFNFDLGYDCSQYATYAWNNSNYLNAAVWELAGTLEMCFDLITCYAGAKAIGVLAKAIPMLYGTLASLSSSSTVVLGKYSGGAEGGYAKIANKIGAKCFQLPDKLYSLLQKFGLGEKINSAWLNGVIKSGARILLNSDPNQISSSDKSSYAMEIRELLKEGYHFVETVVNDVSCWEAIK